MGMTRKLYLVIAMAALTACSTVSVPEIDLMGQSDFNDEISNLEMTYPSADETPALPMGVRSDQEWDQSARDMLALQDSFDVPTLEPSLSDEAFDREFTEAQQEAEAYKLDDPQ